MQDTVTLTARLIPVDVSPQLRSSRCIMRLVPVPLSCAWTGTLLVSCGERETILVVVVRRVGKDWRVETRMPDEEDDGALSIGLPEVEGNVPVFVTSPWHFLGTDWGLRLVVEPAE
jgi:hypothetical protein